MQVPPVAMEEHARWRYHILADGQAASWRMAKLLAINSVILKYRSPSIEYYYRSLKEVRQGWAVHCSAGQCRRGRGLEGTLGA